jgi:hypothetical protein
MKNKDKTLYKIISGRTRLSIGGFVLYVYEPGPKLISKSYEIYEEAYENAYMSGLYIDEELPMLLIEQDIWVPHEERLIEDLKKKIDAAKIEAFENFFKTRELYRIKSNIRVLNTDLFSLYGRKHTFNHLTCDYAAETARFNWLILHTTKCGGRLIKDMEFNIDAISRAYMGKLITVGEIREVARHDTWRAIWNSNKVHGGKLFNKNPTNFSRDQLSLCSYTSMYDNVYEHPESPDPKVIEDDDCLDGWFLFQRAKGDKTKKEKQSEDVIRNPKIRNAESIFVVTSKEDAKNVQAMNSEHIRSVVRQREDIIVEKGKAKDTDFHDIKNELAIRNNKIISEKMKGR